MESHSGLHTSMFFCAFINILSSLERFIVYLSPKEFSGPFINGWMKIKDVRQNFNLCFAWLLKVVLLLVYLFALLRIKWYLMPDGKTLYCITPKVPNGEFPSAVSSLPDALGPLHYLSQELDTFSNLSPHWGLHSYLHHWRVADRLCDKEASQNVLCPPWNLLSLVDWGW